MQPKQKLPSQKETTPRLLMTPKGQRYSSIMMKKLVWARNLHSTSATTSVLHPWKSTKKRRKKLKSRGLPRSRKVVKILHLSHMLTPLRMPKRMKADKMVFSNSHQRLPNVDNRFHSNMERLLWRCVKQDKTQTAQNSFSCGNKSTRRSLLILLPKSEHLQGLVLMILKALLNSK